MLALCARRWPAAAGHRTRHVHDDAGGKAADAGDAEAGARLRHNSPVNVYAADAAGDLSPVVRGDPALVYVPNSESNTVDVISQRTFKVVEQFDTGELPQHVTPAWNLKTLYVDNDAGNTLTPINPRTGKPGRQIPVADPYNLYFTPDGRYAIVVEERLRELAFRNPQHDGADPHAAGPAVPGRRPRRLLGRTGATCTRAASSAG